MARPRAIPGGRARAAPDAAPDAAPYERLTVVAPRGLPDDEITGYEGRIGPGGSVSFWPVRVRDRYGRGGGCCAGVIALVVLGIVASWVLGHVVAGRGRPTRDAARAPQHRAVVTDVRSAAGAGLGTPGHPDHRGTPGTPRTPVGSARPRGAVVS